VSNVAEGEPGGPTPARPAGETVLEPGGTTPARLAGETLLERGTTPARPAGETLLEVRDLKVSYGDRQVVHGVGFDVESGPFGLGLIGESGSGKTTIARAVLALTPASGGTIRFEGRDVTAMRGSERKAFRRAVQVVLQDGSQALDPRMRVGASIDEALSAHDVVPRGERAGRVSDLLGEVGLEDEHAGRYPHQLSGGQRQRAVVARALAVEPRLLVLDEPTSALDVTVQARILALIERLRTERQLSYLLISHNLAVVDRLCERCAVLRDGTIVEEGPTAQVLDHPQDAYTRALRAAVPELPGR
jgi:ABC-type glutathione transport system ATPase component